MKKVLLICGISVFILVSCVKNSAEYQALKSQHDSLLSERDSLVSVNAKNLEELNEIVTLMNEVEDNFNLIKSAENYLSVQSNMSDDLASSEKDKIRSDMQFVSETLSKNREKIAELEKKLKTSVVRSEQLQQTLNNLRAQLDEKTMALIALNNELELKDQKIAELSDNIIALSKSVQDLSEQSNAQQKTIEAQTKELNTVYYCFGTAKELRRYGVLKSGQLGVNFNKDFFIKEKMNKLDIIQLKAKKGKLISKHPDGSYEFVKNTNKQVELKILSPKKFWSLTKYLVVEVHM